MLEKTLESPLDCKKIKPVNPRKNQSWIFLLERLMLKLKLQYSGHLMRRANSLEKTLMLGKTEGRRWRGQQRMRWLDGITDSMDMSLSNGVGDGQGGLACCSPWGCEESDMTEWLNWTDLISRCRKYLHAGNLWPEKVYVVFPTPVVSLISIQLAQGFLNKSSRCWWGL